MGLPNNSYLLASSITVESFPDVFQTAQRPSCIGRQRIIPAHIYTGNIYI